jgi:ubiquitin C-terminal hydrolase
MFRPGRQEDSHEFIRFVLDNMQTRALAAFPKIKDERIKETSVVHRIFGGYLRSQVQCSECRHNSNTYDPFLDLSVEVLRANSVPTALQHFTAPETLDRNNKYKCSGWVGISLPIYHCLYRCS